MHRLRAKLISDSWPSSWRILFAVAVVFACVATSAEAAIRITGFAPASGPVGTSVTLTGEGFSPAIGSNIVRLSGQIATVAAASPTSLTVTVPPGATYGLFNVFANGLTAESPQGFVVTFPVRALNASAFGAPAIFSTGANVNPSDVADIDGDGRPDLLVANHYSLGVYRNDGTGNMAGLFTLVTNIPTAEIPGDIRLSDLDGDGKFDIVGVNYSETSVVVYRNTSSGGAITFGPKQSFPLTDARSNFAVADLDGDGRLDVIVPSWSGGSIRVFRNTGGTNGISFAPPVDFPTMATPADVAVQDLDGDGKPEVVVIHYTPNSAASALVVMRNATGPGFIGTNSLPITALLPASGTYVVFGDLDADGRADLITGSHSHALTIFQNLSTGGNLSISAFGLPVTLATAGVTKRIAVSDLDGDGRLDLAVATELSDSVGIFRNVGGTNGLSSSWFAPRFDLAAGWNADGLSISDLDLDGVPDILFCNIYANQVWLYRGLVLTPPAIVTQPVNTSVLLGGNVSLSVQATGGALQYSWYHNGQPVPRANGATLPISNAQGPSAGPYFVVVQNSGGAITSAVATVTVIVERTFALGAVADVDEGGLVTVPLLLASGGEVGGINFVITYDPTYLALPEIIWDNSLDSALKNFSDSPRGQLHGVLALPATTIPGGTQLLATVQFRVRTIIQTNVAVALGLQISDLSDAFGDPIVNGTEATGTSFNTRDTGFLAGDNNANHQFDVGDATLLLRLLAQLDTTRTWDIPANDFNLNQHLDSGDVIKMLRAIAGLDVPPQLPPPGGGQSKFAGATKSAAAPGSLEVASFSPASLSGQAGQLVTLQLRLDDVDTLISGASFTLNYPVEALRLVNAQSHRAGPAVPAGTLAVWNVAPAQINYATQNGHLTLALGGSTAWAASNTVLAEFTFQVQPAAAGRYLWPITISTLEITGNGFNNRTLGPITGAFVGRSPVSAAMSRLSVPSGGPVSFRFNGDPGASYRIDWSEDLVHWTPLRDVLNHTGSIEIIDAGAAGRPQRFYRNVPVP